MSPDDGTFLGIIDREFHYNKQFGEQSETAVYDDRIDAIIYFESLLRDPDSRTLSKIAGTSGGFTDGQRPLRTSSVFALTYSPSPSTLSTIDDSQDGC